MRVPDCHVFAADVALAQLQRSAMALHRAARILQLEPAAALRINDVCHSKLNRAWLTLWLQL